MKKHSKSKALANCSMSRAKGLKSNKKGSPKGKVGGVQSGRKKSPGKSPTKLW